VRDRGIRSVFYARVPVDADGAYIHSAKPEAFFSEVVNPLIGGPVDGGPCMELFARTRRAHWDAIGNQLPAELAPDVDGDPDVWGYT
jgi:N6-adenosine-specific RNA methylase IME4